VDAETPKSSSEGSFGGRANRSPLNCGVNRLKMMTRENSDLYTEAHAIHIEFFRGENAPETAWSETDDSATGLADIEQTLIDKRSSSSSTKTTKKRDNGKNRLYTETLAQLSDSTSSGITTTLGAADETPWSTLAVSSSAVTLDKAETAAPLSDWTCSGPAMTPETADTTPWPALNMTSSTVRLSGTETLAQSSDWS
jgi:hypothetical protein